MKETNLIRDFLGDEIKDISKCYIQITKIKGNQMSKISPMKEDCEIRSEQIAMTDGVLCQELANEHKRIMLEINPEQKKKTKGSNVLGFLGNAAMFTAGTMGILFTSGLAAPICAPVAAANLVFLFSYARELARPELQDKRMAYQELLGNLNLKHSTKIIPVPFTEASKNLDLVKTLVTAGKEGLSGPGLSQVLSKLDRELIENCKTQLTNIRRAQKNSDQSASNTNHQDILISLEQQQGVAEMRPNPLAENNSFKPDVKPAVSVTILTDDLDSRPIDLRKIKPKSAPSAGAGKVLVDDNEKSRG